MDRNSQIPSTKHQIMIKISMIEIRDCSPRPSPLRGEDQGEGRCVIWALGNWEFFGVWDLVIGI
jgi:hypothetical protein